MENTKRMTRILEKCEDVGIAQSRIGQERQRRGEQANKNLLNSELSGVV
jgi:hypothetical protein